jgi:hypothetical protein
MERKGVERLKALERWFGALEWLILRLTLLVLLLVELGHFVITRWYDINK